MDVAVIQSNNFNFERIIDEFKNILKKGGPDSSDYALLNKNWNFLYSSDLSLEQQNSLYELFKPCLTSESMMGLTFIKPRGYAGDFELIDKIYRKWTSPRTKIYHKWDDYYHTRAGAIAVRNRKEYLKKLLISMEEANEEQTNVLDLASGPCSDLYEFFKLQPSTKIQFDCLDMDKEAIEYSSVVCDNFYKQVKFINKNAFRYKTDKKYNLIWSAGLFDYFSDKLFVRLLNRMYQFLDQDGELVVGNFSPKNSARGLMEVSLQWYLHHRTENELEELACRAGISREKISVGSEDTGVNLFLHIKK